MVETLENTTKAVLEEGTDGKKSYFIEGVFAQADTPNRNKRSYPMKVMEREINNYQKLIDQRRSLGELNHPQHPQVNPERASHLITELRFDGNNVIGKAKVLGTPVGNIVKSLLDENVMLGVSTRGLGSLKSMNNGINEVQDDFTLNTIDIVSDPSGIDCWVNGIMEGAEWVLENGMWKISEQTKRTIQKISNKQLEEHKLNLFQTFLRNLK
jgi:hypothetical protein